MGLVIGILGIVVSLFFGGILVAIGSSLNNKRSNEKISKVVIGIGIAFLVLPGVFMVIIRLANYIQSIFV